MNIIRRFSLIFTIALVITMLYSCQDDDGYDSNPFKIDLATVNVIDIDQNSYYLTLNDGKTTLWPGLSNVVYKPRGNQRVLVNYTILPDSSEFYTYNIRINSISNILTKNIDILTSENHIQFGTDPIKINTIGIGDNFLNIRFEINVGGGEIKHTLSLVKNDSIVSQNDTVQLELKHNAYNDPQRYGEVSYAAFNLRSIQLKNKNLINLKIKAVDYENSIQEYILKYAY